MMKIQICAIWLLVASSQRAVFGAKKDLHGNENNLNNEDGKYWNRVLNDMSMPTPVPTPPPTPGPTPPPTPGPTPPPTPGPTPPPTPPPTPGPTPPPTPGPTPPPTPGPTPPPTPEPTPGPTPPPTPKPTENPECGLQMDIICQTNTDPPIPCSEIPTPDDPQCAIGNTLDALTLSYEDRTCDESSNGQGSDFQCVDFPGVDIPTGEEAQITCYNYQNRSDIYCQCLTLAKTVASGPGEKPLPEYMTCEISNLQGEVAQNITFATSGNVDLRLGDIYGKLRIDGCSDQQDTPMNKQCCFDVNYLYILWNTGPEFTVTEYDRYWLERNSSRNLLPSVPPEQRILQTDEYLPVLQEAALIDVCKDKCYTTTLNATTRNVDCENSTAVVDCFEGIPTRPPSEPTTPTTIPPAPVVAPTDAPVVVPTDAPVVAPTDSPVVAPTDAPVPSPVVVPTDAPVVTPTAVPPTDAPVVAPTVDEKAKACTESGGVVTKENCNCPNTGDFPNTCLIGACGCPPGEENIISQCVCPENFCYDGTSCVEQGLPEFPTDAPVVTPTDAPIAPTPTVLNCEEICPDAVADKCAVVSCEADPPSCSAVSKCPPSIDENGMGVIGCDAETGECIMGTMSPTNEPSAMPTEPPVLPPTDEVNCEDICAPEFFQDKCSIVTCTDEPDSCGAISKCPPSIDENGFGIQGCDPKTGDCLVNICKPGDSFGSFMTINVPEKDVTDDDLKGPCTSFCTEACLGSADELCLVYTCEEEVSADGSQRSSCRRDPKCPESSICDAQTGECSSLPPSPPTFAPVPVADLVEICEPGDKVGSFITKKIPKSEVTADMIIGKCTDNCAEACLSSPGNLCEIWTCEEEFFEAEDGKLMQKSKCEMAPKCPIETPTCDTTTGECSQIEGGD